MTRTGEKGVALVFTLFLMAALSAMAVSMMFLAQTETSASRNYKTMSQARYAGEAGVQRAIHYLSSTAYTNSVTGTSGFDTSTSPVRYNSADVVLKPVAANSNHPDTAIKAAYAALFSNTAMSVGGAGATVTYSATATLLSMRSVAVFGGTNQVIQTWRIEATGTVPGTLPATVEVAGILERDATPGDAYAIFATGNGCGAITMSGGQPVTTDSYDSSNITFASGEPVTTPSGGSVGTNGNLSIGGQVTVNGNLDTPRTGVGNCGNGNITALSQSGNASVAGDRIQLPQAKNYPDPAPPSPMPTTNPFSISGSSTCTDFGVVFPDTCNQVGSVFTITKKNPLTELTWGNVSVSGGVSIVITHDPVLYGSNPVSLNVNSFTMTGNSNLSLGTTTSILMNVAGQSVGGDVVDFEGGSVTNASFDPSRFQILYAGNKNIKLTGGTDVAAMVYAPNASISVAGGADVYGSLLAKSVTLSGGGAVHYDTALASKFMTVRNHVLSSFSWQKY